MGADGGVASIRERRRNGTKTCMLANYSYRRREKATNRNGGCSSMVEPRIVIPAVVGSSPISHPIKIYRLVSIMVITRDCLSCYGSSILPRVAKFYSVRLSVRTQDFHSCKRGSTPLQSTKFCKC